MALETTNRHPRDDDIQFDEKKHVYTIGGDRGYTSVTEWTSSLFPSFNADSAITKMMASPRWPQSPYFGRTRQDIKDQWSLVGREAARAGTALHSAIEAFYNNQEIEVDSLELEYFMDFEKEMGERLTPFRTEWRIWDSDLKIAGTADMLFKASDGSLLLCDWKRCKQIKKENAWETASSPCISHFPNSNFWHYAVQLNTYRYILEKNYGVKIGEMFLVCLHPSNKNESFIRFEIPALGREMEALVGRRLARVSGGRGI